MEDSENIFVLAVVTPVGTDIDTFQEKVLKPLLEERYKYKLEVVQTSKFIKELDICKDENGLEKKWEYNYDKYHDLMAGGKEIKKRYTNVLTEYTIQKIRNYIKNKSENEKKTVIFIRSIKTMKTYHILKRVYGQKLFLIGLQSYYEDRVKLLTQSLNNLEIQKDYPYYQEHCLDLIFKILSNKKRRFEKLKENENKNSSNKFRDLIEMYDLQWFIATLNYSYFLLKECKENDENKFFMYCKIIFDYLSDAKNKDNINFDSKENKVEPQVKKMIQEKLDKENNMEYSINDSSRLFERLQKDWAGALISIDAEDYENAFSTERVFAESDVFIYQKDSKKLLQRFLDILFDNPFHAPTDDEHGMIMAFGTALRSLSTLDQVGAVIIQNDEIIATGVNEVPKFGSKYFESDKSDKPKSEKKIIMQSNRAMHAEDAALSSCCRRGISTMNSTLYSTKLPCFDCTKKIVSCGIKRVVYVEPYAESQLAAYFFDSISITSNRTDNEQNTEEKVSFQQFVGVGARRFFDLFSLNKGSTIPNKKRGKLEEVCDWDESRENGQIKPLTATYKVLELGEHSFEHSNILNKFNEYIDLKKEIIEKAPNLPINFERAIENAYIERKNKHYIYCRHEILLLLKQIKKKNDDIQIEINDTNSFYSSLNMVNEKNIVVSLNGLNNELGVSFFIKRNYKTQNPSIWAVSMFNEKDIKAINIKLEKKLEFETFTSLNYKKAKSSEHNSNQSEVSYSNEPNIIDTDVFLYALDVLEKIIEDLREESPKLFEAHYFKDSKTDFKKIREISGIKYALALYNHYIESKNGNESTLSSISKCIGFELNCDTKEDKLKKFIDDLEDQLKKKKITHLKQLT